MKRQTDIMKQETEKQLKIEQNDVQYSLDRTFRSLGGDQNLQKRPYDRTVQVTKLVHLYTEDSSKDTLSKNQFWSLLNDIYAGVDGHKQLTSDQIKTIMYLVDANGNGQVSLDQLLRIVADNQPKRNKQALKKKNKKDMKSQNFHKQTK